MGRFYLSFTWGAIGRRRESEENMDEIKGVYKVKEPFIPLCCHNAFYVGQKIVVTNHYSKNRLFIDAYETHLDKEFVRGSHNVNRLTFMRCCERVKDA